MYANITKVLARGLMSPLPLRYFFEITHKCNLFCPFCYIGKGRIKEEMTLSQWENIIKQIPRYSLVTLVGGEPLTREDFCEILEMVSKRTFNKTHVVTNGILMNDKITDSFIKNKLLLLSVSLDGFGENHDKYRDRAGIFNKITSNLDNLSEQCKKRNTNIMVDIKTIVLKENFDDIIRLYELATNKGFEYFSLSFLRNNNLKQNPNLKDTFGKEFYSQDYPTELYFDMEDFEKMYLELQKIKKYSKTKIRFAPKFEDENEKIELNRIKKFFLDDREKPVQELYKPCLYPYSNIIINPVGDVYPCLSYRMGNLNKQTLKEIINGKKCRFFRRKLDSFKVFKSCAMCCELKIKESK